MGAAILEPRLANELLTKLKAEDFHSPIHRDIYNSICRMVLEGKNVDAVALQSMLDNVTPLDLALVIEKAAPYQMDAYVSIVKENSLRRNLISYGQSLIYNATSEPKVDNLINYAEERLSNITRDNTAEWEMQHDLVHRNMSMMEQRKDMDGMIGVPSGFADLDEYTGGWQPGQLIFLGAVPKMGKTSAALHFTLNANCPVLFFTLEMLPEELTDRQFAMQAEVGSRKIRTGKMREDEWVKVAGAAGELAQKPVGWVRKSGISVAEMKAMCRRFRAEHGLGLVVIDQLDKIAEGPGESKTERVGSVTRALKNLARDLEVPVICLVQLLDKQVSKRTSPRPSHGDVRDSSYPDQDADVMLYLWRPEFYYPNKAEYKGLAEIIIARQRSGKTGSIWTYWQADYTKFKALLKDYWPKEDY